VHVEELELRKRGERILEIGANPVVGEHGASLPGGR
jgi:hypothetical protein